LIPVSEALVRREQGRSLVLRAPDGSLVVRLRPPRGLVVGELGLVAVATLVGSAASWPVALLAGGATALLVGPDAIWRLFGHEALVFRRGEVWLVPGRRLGRRRRLPLGGLRGFELIGSSSARTLHVLIEGQVPLPVLQPMSISDAEGDALLAALDAGLAEARR
jgi:hypothetical protein